MAHGGGGPLQNSNTPSKKVKAYLWLKDRLAIKWSCALTYDAREKSGYWLSGEANGKEDNEKEQAEEPLRTLAEGRTCTESRGRLSPPRSSVILLWARFFERCLTQANFRTTAKAFLVINSGHNLELRNRKLAISWNNKASFKPA